MLFIIRFINSSLCIVLKYKKKKKNLKFQYFIDGIAIHIE